MPVAQLWPTRLTPTPRRREPSAATTTAPEKGMSTDLANYWLPRSGNRRSDSRQHGHRAAAGASIAPSSPDGCQNASRSYDELVRLAEDIVRGSSPSRADARAHNQLCLLTDDLARVSARSRYHQGSGRPCSCPSVHHSDCVADAAHRLVSTLLVTHPSAAKSVSRTWDKRLREVVDHASGRPVRESESLPPQYYNGL